MQNYVIETDKTGLELISHGDSFFPLAGYDEYFSKFVLKEVPWHWHEEIELVIVLEGSTKVHYINGVVEISQGQGIFINSNILHRLTQTSSVDCHIINFVLKPEFFGGRYDSRVYNKFIKPICSNQSISAIKLTPKVHWERDIIDAIKDAFDIFTAQPFGYELLLQAKFLETWHILCTNNQYLIQDLPPLAESKIRLDKILKHIHRHYDKKLTVKDLATVSNISESECYRLFRNTLQTSPNDYILNHRLQMAAIKLIESNQSMLSISIEVGFGSPSYFSKKFKIKYGMTPKEYRCHYQN